MKLETVIAGGEVVTPAGVIETDVGIVGEKIAAVGVGLAECSPNAKCIDAAGHYVLPGVIDAHVHLDLQVGALRTADDWESGTRAGARGGVTTVIDFATPEKIEENKYESLSQAVDNWHARADGKALIDYTYHVAITNWPQHRDEVKTLIERGFPTFKEYMIYESRGLQSDDAAIYSTLETMREYGGMLLVHAESSRVLDELVRRHHTKALMKEFGARLHAMTRPPFIEQEAIQRAIKWCETTRGCLYIVHVSSGGGADLVKAAQAQHIRVLAETCPQYLVLDESVFEREHGHLFACAPQVKKFSDSSRLWQGLADGEISVISTDNCTFTRKQKNTWEGDFTRIPCGLPGLETLLPIVYTHGVLRGRFDIVKMSRVLSTNPARIMGLYPRKGAIEPGADADIAIIHPTKTITVDPAEMESRADWSPYDGWQLAGFARTTLSRGEVIVDDYKVVGKPGRGKWLPRKRAGIDRGEL